ncbi:MAG: DUF523 domain-containing protein [Porticoccaceae bacterium]|nr:DUF523 domain-containing protein [Pseudomonadales bacterium]MCP5170962.1 DUF523 domain-containing protein [Pseudomonadales bacterium]MCP5301800.1 DUF523 domain-containing protein [Pseudomonadales bacterium]
MSDLSDTGFNPDKVQQPKVGISACLLGEHVRYDGHHKFHPLINELLTPRLNLLPFCPEAAAGLGIPRPPVRLIETHGEISALGVENPQLDVTRQLIRISEHFAAQPNNLVAYIVKSRSPSCGAGSTPLFDAQTELQDHTDGLFVQALKKTHPDLLIVEESWLSSFDNCHQFIANCYDKQAMQHALD